LEIARASGRLRGSGPASRDRERRLDPKILDPLAGPNLRGQPTWLLASSRPCFGRLLWIPEFWQNSWIGPTVRFFRTRLGLSLRGELPQAAAATVPNTLPIDEEFIPCIAASAINTAIGVNGAALGAGATLTTVSAWGYQL